MNPAGRTEVDHLESLPQGPFIDVVIPALNEEEALAQTLDSVRDSSVHEIVVVDGGSQDATVAIAQAQGGRVVHSAPGRASQMNHGAGASTGEVLLFLHADTVLPDGFGDLVRQALADPNVVGGRFDVRLSGDDSRLRVVEFFMNWRSRWTGVATGDQAIFVRRRTFDKMSGFADMPLMEDVDFTSRMRRFGRCAPLRARVRTSSRRWEQNGVARTVVLMWGLRLAYALGVGPRRLAAIYSRGRPVAARR